MILICKTIYNCVLSYNRKSIWFPMNRLFTPLQKKEKVSIKKYIWKSIKKNKQNWNLKTDYPLIWNVIKKGSFLKIDDNNTTKHNTEPI